MYYNISESIVFSSVCVCVLRLILLINPYSDADPSTEWVIRHGRSVGLFIALKEAGDKLHSMEWRTRVIAAVITYTKADRVYSVCVCLFVCVLFYFLCVCVCVFYVTYNKGVDSGLCDVYNSYSFITK